MEDTHTNDSLKNLHSFVENELMLDELTRMSNETLQVNTLHKVFDGQKEIVSANLCSLAIKSALDMYSSGNNRGPEIKASIREYLSAFHEGVVQAERGDTTLEELGKQFSLPNVQNQSKRAMAAGFALVQIAQDRPTFGEIIQKYPESLDLLSQLCANVARNNKSEVVLDKLPRTE